MKLSIFCKKRVIWQRTQLLCMLIALMPATVFATEVNVASVINSDNFVNVTGKVLDENGEPVVGATVLIKGSQSGVQTDEEGVFRINLPEDNQILIISYVGYETEEINVAGRTTIDVVLKPTDAIDEVIVTGYGTQRRSEIVGSVASVSGEELMDIPAPNIAGALRNRVAGLGVSQTSGRPGASITLNVRNSSTAPDGPTGTTAEPLYIIDGVIVDKMTFDNLDASMIEDISILKDASAAIYGAAGAKGVMLVTTKRGQTGRPSITYNGYVGVSDAARRPEMLSAYEHATLMNETHSVANAAADRFFSAEDLEYISGLNYKSYFDEIWKPSLTQRHNLGISGGSERVTFFAGGSYQNENANYPGMKFDKYSFRSSVTADIGKGLKAEVNFNVDHNIRNAQHNMGGDADAGFIESIITTPQWVPMRIDDRFVSYASGRNPLAYIESDYYNTEKNRGYRVNAALNYQPEFLKGFTARFQISQASGSSNSRTYQAPFHIYNFQRMGQNAELISYELDPQNPIINVIEPERAQVEPSLGENQSYQGFLTLQYANTFGRHSVDAIVGGEQQESYRESLGMYWLNQLIPGGEDFWAFDPNTITQSGVQRAETSKRSFFGRLNYDWDKKYLLAIVARLDASSNFALGNRWGWSPSVGAGWIVSQEDFFKDNVSFINFLKLKFNIGITGDDRVGERLWQERYEVSSTQGYLFGSYNGNSLNPSVIPNPMITWERKRTMNFGVEMSFLNNKLDIGAEFFQNKTFDGFDRGTNDITPLYAGFLPPPVNYREAFDWGSEFTIGYRTNVGKDVRVSASMNFAYGNSMVTQVMYAPGKLLEPNIEDGLAQAFGTDPRKHTGSNYGLIYQGTFGTQQEVDAFMAENPNYRLFNAVPQPGWMYFEDTNEDGIINHMDLVPMYENNNPFLASGITLGVTYKSLSLNTNINARFGGREFYDRRARTAASLSNNVSVIWRDRWTPENPDGFMPRFDDPSLVRNSTFWATSGTMIRINNMTLSYSVPPALASRLGLGGARLLATGNNLWTLVNPLKYKDPYTSHAYDYPALRTISLGLSVNL